MATSKKSSAKPAAEKKPAAPRKKRGVSEPGSRGLATPELVGAEPPDLGALRAAIAADGGVPLGAYRDPLGGHWQLLAGLPLDKDRKGRVVVDAAMRCPGRPEVWALGDCAAIPGPDGKPYPTLAQHALCEAQALAGNLHAVLSGGPPRPFAYQTLGVMGSLGHAKAFGQVLGIRLRGFPAWWMRRTYYLLQLPGWARRLHVMADWTFALLFRLDIVKIDLACESALLRRGAAAGAAPPVASSLRLEGASRP